MPEPKRYGSTFGRRATYLLLEQVPGLLAAATFWRMGVWPMVVLAAIVLCLAGWTVLCTRYVIGGGTLDARHGPFRMRVPLRDITAVHHHTVDRGLTYGLGFDFIGIEYGANALNVSPRDTDDFIETLQVAVARSLGRRLEPTLEQGADP